MKRHDRRAEMEWTTRTATVQAGEYAESNVNVVEHVSSDNRFTIRRTGTRRYCRSNGAHGQFSYRWVWTGYRLSDARGIAYGRFNTVARCKFIAERAAQREAR